MNAPAVNVDVLLVPDGGVDEMVSMAVEAEAAGYGRVWVADSPPLGWSDCYTTLGFCARATERVGLGPGVTNPVTRNPFVTAAAMATIDDLSGGRAILGIGVGYSGVVAAGLAPATVADLRSYVEKVREILAARDRHVPVFVAASGPKGLQLAGEIGDGVMISVGTHPSLIAQAVARVEAGVTASGRDRSAVEIMAVAGLAVSDDWDEIRREAAPAASRRALDVAKNPNSLPDDLAELRESALRVAAVYDVQLHASADRTEQNVLVTDDLIDAYALAGSPDACRERVLAMGRAGADSVQLYLVGATPQLMMQRFTDLVLPGLGGGS